MKTGGGILVVGSLNMDMVIEMKQLPDIGETVLGRKLSYVPGGKGANQACAVGKLGGNVRMLGCVGQDTFGCQQLQNLRENQVDTDAIYQVSQKPTGTAVIYVNEQGDNSIVGVAGANETCDKEYLKENDRHFREAAFVMVQMEIPGDAVFYSIQRAKELGKVTVLNPAPAPDTLPEQILEQIDYLTPNETELMKLCGYSRLSEENIRKGARMLLSKGVKNVLVTLGDKGVFLVNENQETLFPARRVQAVDTTAAGDCFNGAFVTALAENRSIEEAARFANMASSIAVTRKGAQSSIPNREEVDRLEYQER